MLSVAEALEIVLQHAKPLWPAPMTLSPELLGLVLAEDAVSDLDMPPFDKAMMDGFAVRSADLESGQATLTIVEEIPAGKTPTVEVKTGQSSRIMTGAPIPAGADAVVMIERCEIAGNKVTVNEPRIKPRMNILERGKEIRGLTRGSLTVTLLPAISQRSIMTTDRKRTRLNSSHVSHSYA